MKYVMIAIFTVCMGGCFYIFNTLITRAVSDSDRPLSWVAIGILLLASIISIVWAAILGDKEDKENQKKIALEIENLELEKKNRESNRSY